MSLLQLLQSNPLFLYFATILLGLVVGSFLNVVIYRLPVMMEKEWKSQCEELLNNKEASEDEKTFNLITPRSRCPQCNHLITALENIPVISYLLQKGKCTDCGVKISPRYPIIETLTAILSVIVVWKYGFSWQAGAGLVLTWSLVALTFIDLDTFLLPDNITLPFLWLGVFISLWAIFTSLHGSVIGAIAGYLSLWLVYWAFKLLLKKEGMGYGDFKLLAMLGAWLGWYLLPLIIILSSLVGAVVGIAMIMFGGHDRNKPIPFGPYLAAAGWIALIWGNDITRAYLNLSGL
jgi:leader peptidase (prepilin peptidase)/N-methyltransferase